MTPAQRQGNLERQAKKRAMQKAGFVHVSGWVSRDDAPMVLEMIDATPQELPKKPNGSAAE